MLLIPQIADQMAFCTNKLNVVIYKTEFVSVISSRLHKVNDRTGGGTRYLGRTRSPSVSTNQGAKATVEQYDLSESVLILSYEPR